MPSTNSPLLDSVLLTPPKDRVLSIHQDHAHTDTKKGTADLSIITGGDVPRTDRYKAKLERPFLGVPNARVTPE
jgi:hypothetical protein